MKTTMLLCLLTFCAEVLFCQKTGWSLSNQPATTRNLNDIYAFDFVDSGRKVHKIPRKIAHPMLVGFRYLFHAIALPIDKKRI